MKRYRLSTNFRRTVPILLFLILSVWLLMPRSAVPTKEISRAKLYRLLSEDAIRAVKVTPQPFPGIYAMAGTYAGRAGGADLEFTITTHLGEAQLTQVLQKAQATIEVPRSKAGTKMGEIVPTVIIAGLVLGLVAYQFNIGRGKFSHRVRQLPQTGFGEIAGIEEAKGELQEIVEFLREPGKYARLGGRLPKGVLLIGPPGTGKTMLARAIAAEAKAHFFSASGSDFNEVFVGVGAKRIRQIFKEARKHRPAIVFIDEIDCLGKNRRFDQNGELQQTNNALLTAMDGFESAEGLVVIGATNRPEDLDDALLRPGRFDRKVYVPLPDCRGRRAILTVHTRRTPLSADRSALDVIAQTTPGMSGADLANLVNEAAILSANRNKNDIGLDELEAARDKVRFGQERKSMVIQDGERRVVAFHEAGHAIIYLQKTLLPPLHKVSIVPRGQALGSTTVLPKEDQNIHGKKLLLEQLAVLMGGRAAEEVFCGDMTNGANGDLESAKSIARKMIHDWGMGEKLYYELEKADAEKEINLLLTNAYEEAKEIIRSKEDHTRKLAEALLVEDTLSREQVLALLQEGPTQGST